MSDAATVVVQAPAAAVAAAAPIVAGFDPGALLVTVYGYHINLGTALIGIIIIALMFAIYKIQSSTRLDFADMLTMDGRKVSLSKFLQLIGGLASTWFIVKTGSNGTLSEGIFGIYLTFIASIEGFSKFMSAKYNYSETSVRDARTGAADSDVQDSLKSAADSAGKASKSALDAQSAVRDAAHDLN